MIVTHGQQPSSRPPGTLRQVVFPQLALLDTFTDEGYISRRLAFAGADTRTLPRTVYAQFAQGSGHGGAVSVGALHEVTFDGNGEQRLASGRGWLADTPEGRRAALGILSQSLFHNSIDVSEATVEVEYEGDFFDDDFKILVTFTQWKLGATTLVGTPAFADAHAALTDDEVTAALGDLMASLDDDAPLVVPAGALSIHLDVVPPVDAQDITAAAGVIAPWEAFHQPEPNGPQKFWVDENGWVSGHVALWDSCWSDDELRCIIPPRPTDGYASYNKPGVLTDRGPVETGPVALYNGHPKAVVGDNFAEAYGGVENAWADVRVIPGVFGPWASGIVRPGIEDEKVYAARSLPERQWPDTCDARAIVSVNAGAYDVPGSGYTTDENGDVLDLVASFPPCKVEGEIMRSLPLATSPDCGSIEFCAPLQSIYDLSRSNATTIGTFTFSGSESLTVDGTSDQLSEKITELLREALAQASQPADDEVLTLSVKRLVMELDLDDE